MRHLSGVRRISAAGLLAAVLLTTGCCTDYIKNRGKDALDVFNVGILVSDHLTPDFGLLFSFWNVFPMGFAHVNGKLIGIGDSRIGVMDIKHQNSWGIWCWGAEEYRAGDFDRSDPESTSRHDQGWLRLLCGVDRPPPKQTYFECDRVVHLGWIGLHLRIHLDQMADFFTGWLGCDILNDDGRHLPPLPEPA